MSLRPERERKPTVNAVMDKYEHLKKMGEALEEAGRNPDGILDYVCCLDKQGGFTLNMILRENQGYDKETGLSLADDISAVAEIRRKYPHLSTVPDADLHKHLKKSNQELNQTSAINRQFFWERDGDILLVKFPHLIDVVDPWNHVCYTTGTLNMSKPANIGYDKNTGEWWDKQKRRDLVDQFGLTGAVHYRDVHKFITATAQKLNYRKCGELVTSLVAKINQYELFDRSSSDDDQTGVSGDLPCSTDADMFDQRVDKESNVGQRIEEESKSTEDVTMRYNI